MIFQDILTQRIIIILVVQIWPIFYGSYISYKILKRAKNRSTYTLSSLFILNSITYFLVTISIFFLNTPYAYILYIIGIYFYIFTHCFLIISSWVLLKLGEKSSYSKYFAIISFYGIISTYVFWLGFNQGIMYDLSTDWIPTFSWPFLIFSWIFLLIFLVLPQVILSFKLLKVFEGEILKRRINKFIMSVFLQLTAVFLIFLYNTWMDNQVFRTISIIIMPVASTIAAFLIYKSFGKELE